MPAFRVSKLFGFLGLTHHLNERHELHGVAQEDHRVDCRVVKAPLQDGCGQQNGRRLPRHSVLGRLTEACECGLLVVSCHSFLRVSVWVRVCVEEGGGEKRRKTYPTQDPRWLCA